LVTGANRGLGLETARQLGERGATVLLCARDLSRGEEAARGLGARSGAILPRHLDVLDPGSITSLRDAVDADFGRLDVLVNNAAILYDDWQQAAAADLAVVRQAFETNTLGPWRMVEAFLPLLRKSGHPRIVNVSSGAGSLTRMKGGTPAYSVSKAALNALTRMLAAELRDAGILVNSVCPGWVATEMGGPGGRPVNEGAAGIVRAATLPDDGPTGGFFRDGRPIPW
jgi:NAD(P)-dependent dehydrogenase (short-subunit alcohol dehydrogenase family)